MTQKIQQFINLFPLKGTLTQEMINKGNINNPGECPGALTLKAALGKNIELVDMPYNLWGNVEGRIQVDKTYVLIGTESNTDFMLQTVPREVVFVFKAILD